MAYYNLNLKPFEMSSDPRFLWLGEKHKEALAAFEYTILESKVLLIVDEAQRLNHEFLEQIRILSNIELNNRKLINIFFVGEKVNSIKY
jgi:type II secretory pathway predicted ATPase ExeA